MVLSISSCTQFLTLKVAVTLTLTLITEIGAVLRGIVLNLKLTKAQSYRLIYRFSVIKRMMKIDSVVTEQ